MVYLQLILSTSASAYGQSTPTMAWRTPDHDQGETLKQPYLRDTVGAKVCLSLPGLPASTEELLWFTVKRIPAIRVMSVLVTKPNSNFFYTVWLITNKVTSLEITNAELTASTSSWTCWGAAGGIRQTADTTRAMTACSFQEDNQWAGFD